MRITRSSVTLLALPTAAVAVSLDDFTPRVPNLSGSCEAVYTEPINGCTAVDFKGSQCGVSCVEALQALEPAVKRACGDSGVTGENIVAAFLANSGPESVCSNANEILSQVGSSSPAPSTVPVTSAAPSPSLSEAHGPVSTVLSGTETVRSLVTSTSSVAPAPIASAPASSSGVLSVDTSMTPSTSAGMGKSTSTTSSTSSSQTGTNDPSGGGSPFDAQGNMNAGASSRSWPTLSLTLTAILALCVGFR